MIVRCTLSAIFSQNVKNSRVFFIFYGLTTVPSVHQDWNYCGGWSSFYFYYGFHCWYSWTVIVYDSRPHKTGSNVPDIRKSIVGWMFVLTVWWHFHLTYSFFFASLSNRLHALPKYSVLLYSKQRISFVYREDSFWGEYWNGRISLILNMNRSKLYCGALHAT